MKSLTRLTYLLLIQASFVSYSQIDISETILARSLSGDNSDQKLISTETIDQSTNQEYAADEYQFSDYGYGGGEGYNNPPLKKFDNEPLTFFGYSYFSKKSTVINARSNIPVPPSYIIGPDDEILIMLYGNKNAKYQLVVNRDGEIFLPEVGPLIIAGLTFGGLRDLIATTISRQFIGTDVSITLGSLRTIDVFIVGAAKNPGMYSIGALSTITNAIFESGGVDLSGSLRNIKLKRNGKNIASFDIYDLLINGDTSNDSRLMQGDVILIEPIGKTAGVRGEVNRPGVYELKEDDNLSDLITFAGGFKTRANKSKTELIRVDEGNNSYDLMEINFNNSENRDTKLSNGDIVSVYPINDKINNAVLVKGHAFQPGFYPWKKGMKILDLFKSTDQLLDMTDLNYVLIKRKNKANHRFSFAQADLESAFMAPNSQYNITLYDEDEILLLPSLISQDLIRKNFDIKQSNDIEYYGNKESKNMSPDNMIMMLDEQEIDEEEIITEGEKNIEMSVFEYCTIEESLIKDLKDESSDSNLSIEVTNECRKQLIEPFLDLASRENFTERLRTISIFGGVHFPGIYPYTQKMKLSDAIKASGGTREAIYVSEIELTRLNNEGNRFVSSNSVASLAKADEIQLQRMDTITVKQLTAVARTVEIKGEVHFPGVYPITENQTLGELINRAGGLTERADPSAAIFIRDQLKKAELQRLKDAQDDLRKKLALAGQSAGIGETALSEAQMTQLMSLLDVSSEDDENDSLGRLVIDLEGIIAGNTSDVQLRNLDSIMIPKRRQSITVIGEVFVSNTHIYDDTLSVGDYLELSGGTTEYADEPNIYVIKADGSLIPSEDINSGFFRASNNRLSSGDTIVVPFRIATFSQLRAATEISQILYQMSIAAAAVNSF